MLKRIFSIALVIIMCLGLAACGNEKVIKSDSEIADNTQESIVVTEEAAAESDNVSASPVQLKEGSTYTAHATRVMTFNPPAEDHTIVQGGYFDGEYFYIAFIKNDNPDSGVIIQKVNTSGKVVKTSGLLSLDHANNLTYNDQKDMLLVSHCQGSEQEDYYTYSFVDIKTLKVVKTGVLDYPFFSMAYCKENGKYVSGEWSGETLDVWDSDLNNILSKPVEVHSSTTSQGVCADDQYIWFVRSGKNGHDPEVVVYNWDLEEKFNILIDNVLVEPESINFCNGVPYIICNNSDWSGGVLYTLEFIEE